jgi:hypothetical protein
MRTRDPGGGGLQVGAMRPHMDLHNIKHKHADQPGSKRVTPYRIHVLPLLNRRGWKQLIVKNVCARCFVPCYRALCDMSVDFVVLTKAHFYAYVCLD